MADVPMIHPGEHLVEILEDMGISATEFTRVTGMDDSSLSAILKTLEPITADVAVRVGKALDMTPEFWLSLQSDYDLEMVSEAADEVETLPKAITV